MADDRERHRHRGERGYGRDQERDAFRGRYGGPGRQGRRDEDYDYTGERAPDMDYGGGEYDRGYTGEINEIQGGGYGRGNYGDEYGRDGFRGGYGPYGRRGRGADWDDFGREAGGETFGRGYGRGNRGSMAGRDYGRGGYGRGYDQAYGDRDEGERGRGGAFGYDRGGHERYGRYGRAERRGEHGGRGPRGYQRSDERIREDVNDRLTDDSWVDASDIEVSVSNCEVTLSGTVDDRNTKRRAEDIAEDVSGVRHVQNNLRVQQRGAETGRGADQTGAAATTGSTGG